MMIKGLVVVTEILKIGILQILQQGLREELTKSTGHVIGESKRGYEYTKNEIKLKLIKRED